MIAICLILAVSDGDTVRAVCDGQTRRIRLAGIDARERNGSCHITCAPMTAAQSTAYLTRRALGQTIRFRIVGRSGKRLVGDNPALRCELLRTGAVVRWDRYWRGYGLGECA